MAKHKNIEEMRSFCCQLHWGSFAGHCFQCNGLGHIMAECRKSLIVEVTDITHGDMLVPKYVVNDNEVVKIKEGNVEKGKGVIIFGA